MNESSPFPKNPFRVHYFEPGVPRVYQCSDEHSYFFQTYVGDHVIDVVRGDCCYWLSDDRREASVRRGPVRVHSRHCANVIRGYMPPDQTTALHGYPSLPYVNGCSTKQIIPPSRPGDPTLQYLHIPPFSAEQAHHIHSTARVALILDGFGVSVVGMDRMTFREELYPGKVCILEPMCPHHFETPTDKSLFVLPLHVFSSASPLEHQHPMFLGTHLTGGTRW